MEKKEDKIPDIKLEKELTAEEIKTNKLKILKTMVSGCYDMQGSRIMAGNRIVANFRAKLGQEPSTKTEDMEKEAKKLLDVIKRDYKKITDGVVTKLPLMKNFKAQGVISDYTELCLLKQYFELESTEDAHFRMLEKLLDDHPIYNEFLKKVKGCGPAMSAVIISQFDIFKAKYVSSMWVYAGVDVVTEDGQGRSKRAEHLVEVEYVTKDGELKKRKSITFNPFLKSKLVGVLASSFLRSKSPYAEVYYNYKNRLENTPKHQEKTKAHRHNMAMRYMIKRFIADLYVQWKEIEGLEAAPEYSETKLGHVHSQPSIASQILHAEASKNALSNNDQRV